MSFQNGFDSSKPLTLTKTSTNPSLALTYSNMAPPRVGPTWVFQKAILKLEIEGVFKRFSKVNLKLGFLKWHKVLTELEFLWIWCQLSGPTSNFEHFWNKHWKWLWKGVKISIWNSRSLKIGSQANWNSGLESWTLRTLRF